MVVFGRKLHLVGIHLRVKSKTSLFLLKIPRKFFKNPYIKVASGSKLDLFHCEVKNKKF